MVEGFIDTILGQNLSAILMLSAVTALICAIDGCLIVGSTLLKDRWKISIPLISIALGVGHTIGSLLGALSAGLLGMIVLPLIFLASILGFTYLLNQIISEFYGTPHNHNFGKTLIAVVAALSGDSFFLGEGLIGLMQQNENVELASMVPMAISLSVATGAFIALYTFVVSKIIITLKRRNNGHLDFRMFQAFGAALICLFLQRLFLAIFDIDIAMNHDSKDLFVMSIVPAIIAALVARNFSSSGKTRTGALFVFYPLAMVSVTVNMVWIVLMHDIISTNASTIPAVMHEIIPIMGLPLLLLVFLLASGMGKREHTCSADGHHCSGHDHEHKH